MFRAVTLSAGVVLIGCGIASANIVPVYQSPDVLSYATAVAGATLDIDNPTPYVWPVDAPGAQNTGFLNEVVDGGGNPLGPVLSRTTLVSQVYRVTTPTVIPNGLGNLSLSAGDLVFAYRIKLTGRSANTIEFLAEFGVTGYDSSLGADGLFDPSQILGRGLTVAGLSNPTSAVPLEQNELSYYPGFSSAVDWTWDPNSATQFSTDGAEELTLLLFSKPAPIGVGYSKFVGNANVVTTVDPTANNIPVLIPIIPTPGCAALVLATGVIGVRRRRHR